MKDYSEFPPVRYFERALKNAPKSALLYAQIWKTKNSQMKSFILKKDTRKDYVLTPTRFRNLLEPLMFLNLLVFEDMEYQFQIEFLGSNSNE